jgi:hypothetical protein
MIPHSAANLSILRRTRRELLMEFLMHYMMISMDIHTVEA